MERRRGGGEERRAERREEGEKTIKGDEGSD